MVLTESIWCRALFLSFQMGILYQKVHKFKKEGHGIPIHKIYIAPFCQRNYLSCKTVFGKNSTTNNEHTHAVYKHVPVIIF